MLSFQSIDINTAVPNDSALWHLSNIVSCIDSLVEVFEKQTLSTGIQSLYDLKNIKLKGRYISNYLSN
jgi:hypothetical protein